MKNDASTLLNDTHKLLTDLKRCSNFYLSSIEININESIDGQEFKEKIDILIEKINEFKHKK